MHEKDQLRARLLELFASQKSLVLATSDHDQPYCSLMAFASSEDLTAFDLVTARQTRKYVNMAANPRVSLMIDNRSNRTADLQQALAVTVLGQAAEIKDRAREQALKFFLARHPQLQDFATSPESAIIRVKVSRFIVVSRFQEVTELDLS